MNKFIDQSMDQHYEEIQFKHKQGQWPHMSLMARTHGLLHGPSQWITTAENSTLNFSLANK